MPSARCSPPATSCSRARSAAPTCRAGTTATLLRSIADLRGALRRRDRRPPGPHGRHDDRSGAPDEPVPPGSSGAHLVSAPQAPRGTFDILPEQSALRLTVEVSRAQDPRGRGLPADRDADVRGHRRLPAHRRRVDGHRPEGDVHAAGRRRALADAAPGGDRADRARLPRTRHAQAAPAGEALVPVELLSLRARAGRPLPPVLADRRRGDRLRRSGRRRRIDPAARGDPRRARRARAAAAAREPRHAGLPRALPRAAAGAPACARGPARQGRRRSHRPEPAARVRLRPRRARAR